MSVFTWTVYILNFDISDTLKKKKHLIDQVFPADMEITT